MIKSTTERHTIKWLIKKARENALDFTIAIQRKEVWDELHKSNLIVSVLTGIPIESLLFEEEGDSNNYLVLDAKQRNSTFISFVNDGFSISKKAEISEINGEIISGKKFSELSEKLREDIMDYELSISILRPLTEDERELVFFMRNQAVPLTKVELTRVQLGGKVMKEIEEMAKHQFMSKVNISASNRYVDQQIVIECLIIEMKKDYTFSGNDLMAFAKELKIDGIDKLVEIEILKTFDFLNTVFNSKYKSMRKVHIPMFYSVARKAVELGMSPEEFYSWVEKFFFDIKDGENEYNMTTQSGVNQKQNILKRLNYINEHYTKNILVV